MSYFGVENLSNLCKLIVCAEPDPREYSTDAEGREYKKKVLVIKGMPTSM